MQQTLCDYCQERTAEHSCEVCGSNVCDRHKKEYGCAVCGGGKKTFGDQEVDTFE